MLERVLDEALALLDEDVLLAVLHVQQLLAAPDQDPEGHLPVQDRVELLLGGGLRAAEEGQETVCNWAERG